MSKSTAQIFSTLGMLCACVTAIMLREIGYLSADESTIAIAALIVLALTLNYIIGRRYSHKSTER